MSQPADKATKKSAANEWVETFVVIVEALLIAIVMMAITYTTRPGHKGLRNWAGETPTVVGGADAEPEQNRFLGVFSR